jgi:hypothetical protein
MQLKGLDKQQVKDHKVCCNAPEMVLANMNKAPLSDGVNDDSMTALAEEFKGMAFLGPGPVLVGELNEDTVTTKLIVGQELKEIEEKKNTKEHHLM